MIHIQASLADEQVSECYQIAGRLLRSNFFFESIPVYRVGTDSHKTATTNKLLNIQPVSFITHDQIAESDSIYSGPGWLGGQWREVSIYHLKHLYCIRIADIGDFYVVEDGSVIYFQWQPQQNMDWVTEALLGPALILALAITDTFCLHASAVALDGQVMAFVGESGWGKSTLTAYLNREVGHDWQFVADDVLPICVDDCGVVCLPHFPQLKLPIEQQWGVDCPRRMPLTAVYRINQPEKNSDSIQIQPLTARDATLTLVRHTVAAKLFDAQLLTKHLDFAAHVVDQISIKQLIYPRVYADLPAVSTALAADVPSFKPVTTI